MGKIFCLMGKSASGKDTLYQLLLQTPGLSLHTIVPCTTRPIRDGETHGVEYYFYTEDQLDRLEQAGKIIELRAYDTIHGVWKYFTADDNQIDLNKYNYLIIGTLESYLKMQDYFGKEALIPLYIYTDDGLRLQRALDRERGQSCPRYAELCRRYLADEDDFSEQKLAEAGIKTTFLNQDIERTVNELSAYIQMHSE